MTTIYATFNAVFREFLGQLSATFANQSGLADCVDQFDAFAQADPQGPLNAVYESLKPHHELITARNESLFDVLVLPGNINLKRLWTRPEVDTQIREAIWSHLSNLYIGAALIKSVPPEMMGFMENLYGMAMQQSQALGDMDGSGIASIMPLISQVLGQVQSGQQPLENLLAGALTGHNKPTAHKRQKDKK